MTILAQFSNGVFALHAYWASGGTTASGHAGPKFPSTGAQSSCFIWLGLSGPSSSLEEHFKGYEYVWSHVEYCCSYHIFVC